MMAVTTEWHITMAVTHCNATRLPRAALLLIDWEQPNSCPTQNPQYLLYIKKNCVRLAPRFQKQGGSKEEQNKHTALV